MRTVTLPNGKTVGQVPDNVSDSDIFKQYGFQDIEPVTSKTRIVTLPNGKTVGKVPDNVSDSDIFKQYGFQNEESIPLKEDNDIQRVDSPSILTDVGRAAMGAISSIGTNLVTDVYGLISGEKVTPEKEQLMRREAANLLRKVSPALSLFPEEDVVTPEGDVKETETLAGGLLPIVPYVVGGTAIAGSKLIAALPLITRGLIGGATIDQVLYEGDENLFNFLNETEFAQAENVATDLIDFLATKEDDSILEERAKLLVEGLILGGGLAVLGTPKIIYDAAQKKFNKPPNKLTGDEEIEVGLEILNEAKDNFNYKKREPGMGFSETVEGLEQVAKQSQSLPQRIKQQIFTSRGYLTPNAYNIFTDSQYAQRQLVAQAENISSKLQKSLNSLDDKALTKKVTESVQEALTENWSFNSAKVSPEAYIKYISESYDLPMSAAEAVYDSRVLIDELSRAISTSPASNKVLKEIIGNNAGSYLRRSYRLFEDTGYKPSESIRQNAIDYLTDIEMEKGINYNEAAEIAESNVYKILSKGDPTEEWWAFNRRVNKELLKGKKDIPEPIRKLMGEIEEPSENIVLTISKMAKLAEDSNFFESLKNLGERKYFFKNAISRDGIEYTTEIKGTNSNLDGMFTTPEMLSAIQNRDIVAEGSGIVNNFVRNFAALKGSSQALKTVYSHVTHIRNVVGGAQFGLANGINPFKEGSKTFSILKNQIRKGGNEELEALYEKYLRFGLVNTSIRLNEFRALLDVGFQANSAGKLNRLLQEKVPSYGKKLLKVPGDIYQATDDFYKINIFNTELKLLKEAFPKTDIGILEEQAAKIVRDTLPNYDRVPKGIKALRYAPVGNFVSFPAEIMRTSINIIKQGSAEITSGNAVLRKRGLKRLAGFSTAAVGWGSLANMTANLAGFTEEEAKAISTLSKTPWSSSPKNIAIFDGQIFTNDTKSIDTYSVIKEPFEAAYNAIVSGKLKGKELDEYLASASFTFVDKLISPYIEESMISKSLTDVLTAMRDSEGRTSDGKQIMTSRTSESAVKMLEELGNALIPGSLKSIYDLLQAGFEVPNDITNKPKNFWTELAANLTGVRFTPFNVEDQLMFAKKRYAGLKASAPMFKFNYGTSPDELKEKYYYRQKAIYEATQDFYESILAAETLVGRKETVKILVDNGMSVKEIKRFFSNRFRGQDISLASLKKMSQEIDFGGDAASKKKTMEALFDLEERFSRTPIFPPAPEKGIGRIKKSKGGTVEIPNAPEEPDERIDKVTGLPYNLQAGKAFIDVEDRKGFAGGGMTRPDGTKKSPYYQDNE
jgi:hypothetical protein